LKMTRRKSNSRKIVAAAFLLILCLTGLYLSGAFKFLMPASIGYSNGGQGFSMSFDNVYWNNAWWSRTTHGTSPADSSPPSDLAFGYTMDLNPDSDNAGMPALCASSSGTLIPDLTNQSGNDMEYVWQIPNGTATVNGQLESVYEQYQMELVQCSWQMNVWLSGTGTEAGCFGAAAPNWEGAQIWITMTPNEFVYFQDNPQHVYFAPAWIGLAQGAQYTVASYDAWGQGWTPTQSDNMSCISIQNITPSSQGEATGIYYTLGGHDVSTSTLTKNAVYQYEGQPLDSSIFQPIYYTRVDLNTFMAKNYFDLPLGVPHLWMFPSVQLNFRIFVWVVGQWQVYFNQNQIPKLTPHGFGGGNFKLPTATNPFSAPILILIVLAVLAVIVIFAYVQSRSRKSGQNINNKIKPASTTLGR